MYGFIPSWYGSERNWVRDAKVWHNAGEQLEFDDAVNQIKMFKAAGEDVEVILPGCMPELRHFMHREKLDDVKVWSVFDYIQNIKGSTARQIHLSEFSWPDDIEWFYTPFLMLGYRNGSLYARAEFNEEGWWVEALIYENESPIRRIHIDDRGFVSYVEYYRNGQPLWRYFYDRKGKWQIKEDIKRKNVYVNPAVSCRFNETSYGNLRELIEEVLRKYLSEREKEILIVAHDDMHNAVVQNAAGEREIAYSVFSQRNGELEEGAVENLVQKSRLLVTDTEYLAEELKKMFPSHAGKILDISPYDTRLALGKSTTIKMLKILLYLDSDTIEDNKSTLKCIFEYMKENSNTFLTIGIGRKVSNPYTADLLKLELRNYMELIGVDYEIEGDKENVAENETEDEVLPRIAVEECRTEIRIIELLSDHRIIIEPGKTPDLYLQVAGISAGLPVVLYNGSQYVSHRKNGWILSGDDELTEALHYYLDGLANWNESLIWSLRRIGEYTNGSIVARWKDAMVNLTDGSNENACNTDR